MDGLTFRSARPDDVQPLNALIHRSAEQLSRGFYTPAEIEAANRFVFGVDTTLVRDGTYFVGEVDGDRIACGGWSRRGALYGGDQRPMDQAPVLDPATEPARIRAFFVDPAWARRGIGSRLLQHCERAAWAEGYRALELMATLPGVPLYAMHGFTQVEPVADVMPNGVTVRFIRMRKPLVAPPAP